ncbi:MAG: hypothetical protein V3R52_01635 [Candidatus Neomarinimicrobiota bacterium]
MHNNQITNIIVLIASIVSFFSCTENTIPYNLSGSGLDLDTLTVRTIEGGTYLTPPSMGSTDGLYFGSSNDFNNLFSLLQYSSVSLSGTVRNYNLLDSTVTVDSLVFTFTATADTLFTDAQFELYYFPESGDSLFNETESNYLNLTETDVIDAVPISRSIFVQEIPDSTESIYPILSFKIDDYDDIIDFIADTANTQNRTFMLKNIDQLDEIVSIRSSEKVTNFPIIDVYYRAGEDTIHSVFYAENDITIVEPRQVTDSDMSNLSVGRATGLKSLIKFDFSNIPIDSSAIVIRSAELIFNLIPENSFDDFEIIAAVLQDSVNILDFWEVDEDQYSIESDVLMTGTFSGDQLKIEIRSFLQGVNTGSYNNFGLKLYGSSSSDPFQSANLVFDQNNSNNNPYLKIAYVKL